MKFAEAIVSAALCALATACGGGRPVVRNETASTTPAADAPPDATALEHLRADLAAGNTDALGAIAMRLERAHGARDLSGDEATDDRVSQALVLTRVDTAAALLVTTTCGNAIVATVRWEHGRWTAATHIAFIDDMRPGQCGTSLFRAESLALSSDERREIAVVWGTEDATGADVRGPFLSVFRLEPTGALDPLLRDAPFGTTDDTTGATTVGHYAVVEEIPPPRDLHVTISPGRLGPGGAPAAEIVRRRYALRGAQLVLVEQSTDAAE